MLTGSALWFSASGIFMRMTEPTHDVSDRLIIASICFVLALVAGGLLIPVRPDHITLHVDENDGDTEPHTVMALERVEDNRPPQ